VQRAEVIDLGVEWDGGAPLPHLLTNGLTTILMCHAPDVPADWDGTTVRVVSPSDEAVSPLLQFTFSGCWSVRLGFPNDETLNGHPLWERGLGFYQAHIVHNSLWRAEVDAVNSVHSQYAGPNEKIHYLFTFHDETFEALADSVDVVAFEGTLSSALLDAARAVTVG